MAIPNAIIIGGHGLNCEDETKFAFDRAGARAKIVHIDDLAAMPQALQHYQILTCPGGFSYGDYTGSGLRLANRLRDNMWEELLSFVAADKLVFGICNGFQVLVNLGLLPGLDGNFNQQVALTHNTSARYKDRWVDLNFEGESPWFGGLATMSLPIAHGEGRFYTKQTTLGRLNEKGLIGARYISGEICRYQQLEANPNGSLEDIAAITNEKGNVAGMMPHPERAIDTTQLPNYHLLQYLSNKSGIKMPRDGPGLNIFRNAVKYFS